MTLASGCGTRTMVRIGGGNAKSLVVLAIGGIAAYWMMWTPLWAKAFQPWIAPTNLSLQRHGVASQELSAVLAGMFGLQSTSAFHLAVGAAVVAGMLWFVWKSVDFRGNRDHILGGAVVGLAVTAGWWLTGGPVGRGWKEFANFNMNVLPLRTQTQSYTFVSPMGDGVHYLLDPANFSLVTFGVAGMAGVIVGSLLWAIVSRSFRVEWFASWGDFGNHAVGSGAARRGRHTRPGLHHRSGGYRRLHSRHGLHPHVLLDRDRIGADDEYPGPGVSRKNRHE